jgi:hypothetical protein
MNQIVQAAIIIGLLSVFTVPLCAEEPAPPVPPSGSVQQGSPRLGPSTGPEALMGFLGMLPKAGAGPTPSPQVPYPMFQFLGPNLWGGAPINSEMMGYLLRLQGELMMKMGEVLVKYGQMIEEKKQ